LLISERNSKFHHVKIK